MSAYITQLYLLSRGAIYKSYIAKIKKSSLAKGSSETMQDLRCHQQIYRKATTQEKREAYI